MYKAILGLVVMLAMVVSVDAGCKHRSRGHNQASVGCSSCVQSSQVSSGCSGGRCGR